MTHSGIQVELWAWPAAGRWRLALPDAKEKGLGKEVRGGTAWLHKTVLQLLMRTAAGASQHLAKERIAPLSEADQRKVLETNTLRFYGIDA